MSLAYMSKFLKSFPHVRSLDVCGDLSSTNMNGEGHRGEVYQRKGDSGEEVVVEGV